MARIRYLKPDFFKDEDLVEHSYWIRLLFAGLWNIADKEGRLEDRPKRIKVDLFPYGNEDIEKGLVELANIKNHSTRPFIQRYEVNGEKYIQIVNWHKHQKPHHTEKDSIIPPPPPLNLKGMGMGNLNQHEASAGLSNGEITVNSSKPIKGKYLDFVLLSLEEYDKLIGLFGKQGVEDRIARLNDYIGSKGIKYKSHYFTILNWERKNIGEQGSNLTKAQKSNIQGLNKLMGELNNDRQRVPAGLPSINSSVSGPTV